MKMKKILGTITLSIFAISIIGSVSPSLKTEVIKLTGDKKYASTIIPLPSEIDRRGNNFAGKIESKHYTLVKESRAFNLD